MVDDTGDGPLFRYLLKPITRRVFRGAYEDLSGAEDEIHRSDDVDWTIMRPPRLTDKPASGRYRTSIERNLPRSLTIPRADLATSILAALDDPRTQRRHVFVAS